MATRARSGDALQPAPRRLAWRFPTQSPPALHAHRTSSRPELRGVPLGPGADPSLRLSPAPSHTHAGRGSSWRGGIPAGPLGRAVLVCCGLSLLPGAPPGPQKARGGGGGKADPQPGTPVLPGPWSRRSAFTSGEEQPAPSGTSRLSLGPGLAERRGVTSGKRSVTSRGWSRDVAPAGKELPAERLSPASRNGAGLAGRREEKAQSWGRPGALCCRDTCRRRDQERQEPGGFGSVR